MLRNDKKEAAQQKSERAHKKGGRRQNKGKVDLQERRKDRPSFLLLALPTCQTQIHLNIPLFGLLGSKCSGSMGMRAFLKKTCSCLAGQPKALSNTEQYHMGRSSDPDDDEDSLPMLGGHNAVEPKWLTLHRVIHLCECQTRRSVLRC